MFYLEKWLESPPWFVLVKNDLVNSLPVREPGRRRRLASRVANRGLNVEKWTPRVLTVPLDLEIPRLKFLRLSLASPPSSGITHKTAARNSMTTTQLWWRSTNKIQSRFHSLWTMKSSPGTLFTRIYIMKKKHKKATTTKKSPMWQFSFKLHPGLVSTFSFTK